MHSRGQGSALAWPDALDLSEHQVLLDVGGGSGAHAIGAAAMGVQMLLWAPGGEQYSGRELAAMLAEAGFAEVEVKSTFGYWSVVTGRKPVHCSHSARPSPAASMSP